ncbi:hypothetical protein KHQ81_08300 [Mycoplasmatota bacterium]|nr:hypothetical protein KHQ81_08300 [Mycoplasmatota bacterium]
MLTEVKKRRREVIHVKNPNGENISDLGLYELLVSSLEESNEKDLYFNQMLKVFREERKIYKNIDIHEDIEFKKFINDIYNYLYLILIEKKYITCLGNNLFTSD